MEARLQRRGEDIDVAGLLCEDEVKVLHQANLKERQRALSPDLRDHREEQAEGLQRHHRPDLQDHQQKQRES